MNVEDIVYCVLGDFMCQSITSHHSEYIYSLHTNYSCILHEQNYKKVVHAFHSNKVLTYLPEFSTYTRISLHHSIEDFHCPPRYNIFYRNL
jgi:hypothetical protein